MITPRGIRKQTKRNTVDIRDIDPRQNRIYKRVLPGAGGSLLGAITQTHKAYPVNDAGTGTTIDCYLDTDLTGEVVEVNCSIFGGSDLNEASPLLEKESNPIFISLIGEEWWCISPFDTTEECECTAP